MSNKKCGFSLPYLVDLVEDNLRNRFLFPLSALLLYILIVISITSVEETLQDAPQEVKAALPFRDSYDLNMNFNNTFPAPRIKVTNKQGPIPGIEITSYATDLLIQNDDSKPNCDSMFRRAIAATLEYLRMEDVCRVVISGKRQVTGKEGYATFDNFTIVSGPQGIYSFVFASLANEINSEEYQMFLKSNATRIVVHSDLPVSYQVGTPFPVKAKVTVFDENDQPVKKTRVAIFSWPSSKFSGSQEPYLSHPYRFGWLDGNEATTDDQGQAVFEDLRVYGGNSDKLYLFFCVNGVIIQQWGVGQPQYAKLLDIQTQYSYPLQLKSTVARLVIVKQPKNIQEMEQFGDRLEIRVLDENGNGVKDQLVFCRIIMANGDVYPLGYPPYRKGHENKQLLYSLPGVYSVTIDNPLSENKMVYPLLSSSNGTVFFEQMRFSTHGTTGNYQLRFECLNAHVDSELILVMPIINSLQFVTEPLSYINLLEYSLSDMLTPTIQVLDLDGKGIKGKTPTIQLLDVNGQPIPQSVLDVRLAVDSDQFKVTNQDGYSKLVFQYRYMLDEQVTFTIKATVDGLTALSRSVTLQRGEQYKTTCGTILSDTYSYYLNLNENKEIELKVIDNLGAALANQDVYLAFNYISETVVQFPKDVYPPIATQPQKTDSAGTVKFDLNLPYGTIGTVEIMAITFTALSSTLNSQAFGALLMQSTQNRDLYDETLLTLEDYQNQQEVQLCYSLPIKLDIQSTMKELVILNLDGESAQKYTEFSMDSFRDNMLITNKEYTLEMSSDDPVTINYLTVPPYLLSVADPIQMVQSGSVIKIRILHIGSYTINLHSLGAYSDALFFTAVHPNYADFSLFSFDVLKPVQQQQSTNQPVGKYLTSGQVQLKYNDAPVEAGLLVVASIDYAYQSQAILDITDIGSLADPMAVYSSEIRLATTDSTGTATFDKLSVTDIQGDQQCIRFKVYIGWSDNLYTSGFNQQAPFGEEICFSQNKQIEIISYSTRISQGIDFPAKIKVTKDTLSDYDTNGLIVYAAMPYRVNSYTLPNPYQLAPLYLSNFVCVYASKKATPTSRCTPEIDIQGSGPYTYKIEWKGLEWIQSQVSAKFQLTVADPLNYYQGKTEAWTSLSNEIEVSNVAAIIEITSQPPSLITVGDSFACSVKVKISSGLPVTRGTVTAFITPDPATARSASMSELKDLIFTLASGAVDAKSISKLTQKQNVILDPLTNTQKTNRQGEAEFNLKVLSALPGKYTMTFQSGNAKSDRSITFQIENRILECNITQQVNPVVYKDGGLVNFTTQPKLKLKFQNDLPFLGNKIIEVRVYKWVDPAELQEAVNQTKTAVSNSMEVLIDEYNSQDKQLQASAYDTIKNTWNAILNGGKIIKQVDKNYEKLNIKFSYPEEKMDGTLVFKDLSIEWKNSGMFMLVFTVNGIESAASTQFQVQDAPKTVESYVVSVFETILIIATVATVLLGTTARNHSFYLVIGFAVAVTSIGLITLSENPLAWLILVWITIGSMVVIMIYMFVNMVLLKNSLFPHQLKSKLFQEYTYQLINRQPSQQWVDFQKTNAPYNDFPRKAVHPEEILNLDEPQENTFPIVREQPTSFLKNFMAIFVPFGVANNKVIVGNCFYYPQRIFAGSLLSFVSISYIAYQAFLLTSQIESYIDSLNSQIKSANFIFMYGSLNALIATFNDSPFPEDTFQKSQEATEFITYQMTLLGEAMTISFSISTTLSCIIFLFAFFVLLYDFRQRALEMRKGEYQFIKERIYFAEATNYIGTQVANSAVSFIIVLMQCQLFFNSFQRLRANFHRSRAPSLLAVHLGKHLPHLGTATLFKRASEDCPASRHQGIKYRRLWSIFELFMLYVAIAGGLLSALSRIIILIVLSMIGLARLDQSLFPQWINDAKYLDSANNIYLAALYMYHCHNHPVAVTALRLMLTEELKENTQEENQETKALERKRMVRKRLSLLAMKMANSELRIENKPVKVEEAQEEPNQSNIESQEGKGDEVNNSQEVHLVPKLETEEERKRRENDEL